MKQSHATRAARKFWLFNDVLVYARIVPGTGVAMVGEKYLLNDKLSLQSIMVSDIVPTDAGAMFPHCRVLFLLAHARPHTSLRGRVCV